MSYWMTRVYRHGCSVSISRSLLYILRPCTCTPPYSTRLPAIYPMTVKSISLSDTTSTWREHKNIYNEDIIQPPTHLFYLSTCLSDCFEMHLTVIVSIVRVFVNAWLEYGTACMRVASDDSIMISLFWILWSINAINKWGQSPACLLDMYVLHSAVYAHVCPMISKLNNLSIHWKDSSDCWKHYLQNVWRTQWIVSY